MSLLYRNGTGRNNIVWGGSTSTSGNYLRRTSTGRNDISFINISSNGTYNILNRTSTGINDIQWINTVFSFFDLRNYPLTYIGTNSSTKYMANVVNPTGLAYYSTVTVSKNRYTFSGRWAYTSYDYNNRNLYIKPSGGLSAARQLVNMIKSNYDRFTYSTSSSYSTNGNIDVISVIEATGIVTFTNSGLTNHHYTIYYIEFGT